MATPRTRSRRPARLGRAVLPVAGVIGVLLTAAPAQAAPSTATEAALTSRFAARSAAEKTLGKTDGESPARNRARRGHGPREQLHLDRLLLVVAAAQPLKEGTHRASAHARRNATRRNATHEHGRYAARGAR